MKKFMLSGILLISFFTGCDFSLEFTFNDLTVPTDFFVTYDANGADSGLPPTDENTYKTGEKAIILGNPGTLAKTEAYFSGWNRSPDGSGESCTEGQSIVIGKSDITLYAKWNGNPVYRLFYDANGADSGEVPAALYYESGSPVIISGNSGLLVKAGMNFVGWNTEPAGDGFTYLKDQIFTIGGYDVTLYAKWSGNPVYRIFYEPNGADSGSVPVDENLYEAGSPVIVLGNTSGLQKQNNSFIGWNTNSLGTGVNYTQGTTYNMGNTDCTLYANWSQLPVYTITYIKNNPAAVGNEPVDSTNYPAGSPITVMGQGSMYLWGYHVDQWNTRENSTGASYEIGLQYNMPAYDLELYAIWAINEYTVEYDTRGGTPVGSVTVSHGSLLTQPSNPGRDHYTFQGWFRDPGCTDDWNFSTDTVTADTVLYAKWNIDIHTVSFNPMGGDPINPNPQYVEYGGYAVKPNANRMGYTLDNWYKESGYITHWKFDVDVVTENITLYAKWNANMYTVTFDSNGGTTPVPSAKDVLYDSTYGILPVVTRAGYDFTGWWNEDTGYVISSTPVQFAGDHTLQAIWEANEYIVSFELYYEVNHGDYEQVTYTNEVSLIVTYDSIYGEGRREGDEKKGLPQIDDFEGKDPALTYTSLTWFSDPDFFGYEIEINNETIVTTPSDHILYGLLTK